MKNKKFPYGGLPRSLIFEIHKFVLDLRKKQNLGQRTLARKVKERFNVDFSESTISGWIHRNIVPYANEKTQFKSKPIPSKRQLVNFYLNKNLSASKIAKQFNVSTIIAINWLKYHNIKVRSHLESMNTSAIKKELREKSLTIPKKDYSKLTKEKAYLFGVLAGDGFIDKRTIRFEIKKDVDFIEEFSKCLEEVYGIKYNYKYYAPRDSYVLYATSEIICKDLLNYGDFRTFSWRIPFVISNSKNMSLIGAYLKGLYDSEGSVTKYNVTFSSDSKKGIFGVKSLLEKLGINSKIALYQDKHYSLRISKKENLQKFKKLVGFTIKRKMERLK